MLVSVLQNRRKKGKDNSVDKIKQYLKMTQKSSFSTSITKSNVGLSSPFTPKIVPNQNQLTNASILRPNNKNTKGSVSTSSLLVGRTPFNNCQINGINQSEQSKSFGTKLVKQHYKSSSKIKLEIDESGKGKKGGYMLCHLSRKNKAKNEIIIGIHNSIFTFRQYLKASLAAMAKPVNTKITPETPGRKTLVFDMDQTLIHTNQTVTKNYQIKVPFRSFQGRIAYGYVQVRPYAKEILKKLSQHFDIFIFTASTQAYADPIIDHIDPDKVVQHRLYRQSCSLIRNQVFVKDLRVLGRKLQNVLLIDNAPYSYMMQLENGVPIIPYYRGKDDDQLVALQEYLMNLKDVQDVRKPNSQYFKLHEYCKFDSHEKLVNKLYGEWLK